MPAQLVAEWVDRYLVPTFLGTGVLAGFVGAGRVTAQVRVTAYAGFWAGLLATAALTLLLPVVLLPSAPDWPVAVHSSLGLFAGTAIGAGGLTSFWLSRRSRWVGAVCFVQSFGASACLLGHFLETSWTPAIGGLAVGCALGPCLVFIVPRRWTSRITNSYEDRRIRRIAELREASQGAEGSRRYRRMTAHERRDVLRACQVPESDNTARWTRGGAT